jgi:hypothetical protein
MYLSSRLCCSILETNPSSICVEMVEVQGIIDNVFQLMFRALETLVGVSVEVLGCKFISIGTNGNNVFQGSRMGVIIQMKEIVVACFMGVHCFAH